MVRWLINIGDKVLWQSKEWEVYSIEEHIVELRRIEDGFGIGTKVDLKFLESNYFKQLYEQQKKRADELEQKLNKEVEENYQMENRWRTEIERADTLQHAIMQIRNDLVMENEERNSSAIERLNTLLGVIEDD